MPGLDPVMHSVRDLADDLAYHGLNVVQGVFDMLCVGLFVACIYATSLGGTAKPQDLLPSPEGQVSELPSATSPLCLAFSGLTLPEHGGCITAQVLDASFGI